MTLSGERLKSFKPHGASISDIIMDATGDFVGTSSIDGMTFPNSRRSRLTRESSGQIVIHSLSTTEAYAFDLKRPMRTLALEPQFAKKSSRAFVCGGLAGSLVMHEKGWLGHKETVLHSGEGPVWQVRWRGRLIAWANDLVSV